MRTESSDGRPSGRSRIRFVRPGLGRNGCAESNRRETGPRRRCRSFFGVLVCECVVLHRLSVRKRSCRRAVAVFGSVHDGRRFGKRKQGILDKLSRRGLRMRRKADADNSRIGVSVRLLPTFIVRFFRLFLCFCRKHGPGIRRNMRSGRISAVFCLPSAVVESIFDKVCKNDSGTALKRFPNSFFRFCAGKIVRASDATDCGQRRVSRSSIRCFRRGGRRLRRSASSDRSPNMI